MPTLRASRVLALLTLLFLCSCAAIFDGCYDEVTIQSDPPGANIQVNGQEYVTPVTVELRSKGGYTVTGPRGETYPILARPNRLAVIESLLILPILPDFLTGAYNTLEPSVITLASETTPLARPEKK